MRRGLTAVLAAAMVLSGAALAEAATLRLVPDGCYPGFCVQPGAGAELRGDDTAETVTFAGAGDGEGVGFTDSAGIVSESARCTAVALAAACTGPLDFAVALLGGGADRLVALEASTGRRPPLLSADAGDGDDEVLVGPGGGVVHGGPGRDSLLVLGTAAGHFELEGDDGDDRLTVLGAGSANMLGGAGHDALTGAPGGQWLDGGPGDDTLRARHGDEDILACGDGVDVAEVDPEDTVLFPEDCEQLSVG